VAAIAPEFSPGASSPNDPQALSVLIGRVKKNLQVGETIGWGNLEDGEFRRYQLEARLRELEAKRGLLTKSEGAGDGSKTRAKRIKEPSKIAIEAYRTWKFLGKNQDGLGLMFGVKQSTVSRWVNTVDRWLKAGNVLPDDLARPSTRLERSEWIGVRPLRKLLSDG
jgi:hypothetical protein